MIDTRLHCERIPSPTSLTHLSPHILFFWMRPFKFYYVSNFSYKLQSPCFTSYPQNLFILQAKVYTLLPIFPYFSHLSATFLLFVCMSLTFFYFTTSDNVQYLSSSVWLISLSIMPLCSLHAFTNGKISIFLMDE